VYKSNFSYVDFLTGYFWAFKNIGLMYDWNFGKFWHEELDLSFQIKAAGYKLKVLDKQVCSHYSMRREEVDWELHNKNLEYVKNKWKDKQDLLRLGGN
jgi:hypothetical protein